jgi:multidrug efflux pump subunit AcrB
MWIVKLALRQPYTFVVIALLILLLGVVAIRKTPTDIFPVIDIPVISVIWTYNGLSTPEMESRIALYSEFSISAAVNDVKDIESQTLNGVSVIKIFFHPTVSIDTAMAQLTAVSGAIQRRMPPGINPPIIVRFNASSVPIIQLGLSGEGLTESQLYDFGIYRVRQQLAAVQGATLPAPYGGLVRQMQVDIAPERLQATGLSAIDVSAAVSAQNLTLPSGTARIGEREYSVALNSNPLAAEQFNDIPIKTVNGRTIFMRDVANVRDGSAVQQNIVRSDGERGVLLTVLKNGRASTLDVIDSIKSSVLPSLRAIAPPGLKIRELFDQSVFVRAAVKGVITEGVIAACLTAMMILLFLGSWRSTLIVVISIPLSVLSSLIVLYLKGESLNVMTLGGLALAVGILVDDATVTIENIYRHIEMRKPLREAILDGAAEIATPTLVSTLTICIVFVSVVFLTGPAKYLFTPLALSVVFAMLASYLLSRTLAPVMASFLLGAERHDDEGETTAGSSTDKRYAISRFSRLGGALRFGARMTTLFSGVHHGFNQRFERFRERYERALDWALSNTRKVYAIFGVMVASSVIMALFVGRDFFPFVDAGQMKLHMRTPAGTRVEETERIVADVEREIREVIPPGELELILDNIGRVSETFNLAFTDGSTIGAGDAELLIALKEGSHAPTAGYMKSLRQRLNQKFPNCVFFFQPADITTQILNFGLPAPIDLQVTGLNRPENYKIARELEKRIGELPGAVDAHLHQVVDGPQLFVDVDRARASELGLTHRDVANSLLVSLSGSAQVFTNFWPEPTTGLSYLVEVKTPIRDVGTMDALSNTPLAVNGGAGTGQLLGNVARIERGVTPMVANHHNAQPVFDIYAGAQDRDLGALSRDIDRVIAELQPKLPAGSSIAVRGQVESMNSAFVNLGLGLIFAAVLVYFLMVVNFQSWLDPFIIITALPGALCGIVWMLFLTQTTFSVPSLMGAIMTVGVATANSILLVTFAKEQIAHSSASEAAYQAGRTRLRPILMTALAMIIGMTPMALGLGEGGEQNAPLGRAVIGGLIFATITTLFFVPVVFSALKGRRSEALNLNTNHYLPQEN